MAEWMEFERRTRPGPGGGPDGDDDKDEVLGEVHQMLE